MWAESHPLYPKLKDYRFDDPGTKFTFEKRLARENGWTAAYAHRVIDEYRRFVFLAMVAGHPVTPSEAVDQVWHLHLTYTQRYWNDLCERILPRPLHHNPTRGGAQEGMKFEDWYARTRRSYESWFRTPPPRDIWPESTRRFGHDLDWKRVNLQDYWIIPKSTGHVLGATGLGIAACSALGAALTSKMGGWATLVIAAGGVFVVGIFAVVLIKTLRAAGRSDAAPGALLGAEAEKGHESPSARKDSPANAAKQNAAGGCSGGCGGVAYLRADADAESAGEGDGGGSGDGGCSGGGCGGGGCGGCGS